MVWRLRKTCLGESPSWSWIWACFFFLFSILASLVKCSAVSQVWGFFFYYLIWHLGPHYSTKHVVAKWKSLCLSKHRFAFQCIIPRFLKHRLAFMSRIDSQSVSFSPSSSSLLSQIPSHPFRIFHLRLFLSFSPHVGCQFIQQITYDPDEAIKSCAMKSLESACQLMSWSC